MTDLLTPESGLTFGALDSDAFADGRAGSAHLLREIAKSSNFLLGRDGDVVLNLCYTADTQGTDEELGGASIAVAPIDGWSRAAWGPLPCPKRPHARSAELRVVAKLDSGLNAWLTVETLGSGTPSFAKVTSPTTLEMLGTGSWETYSLTGVPLVEGGLELVSLWLSASPDSTPTHTGTVTEMDQHWFEDSGATFAGGAASWRRHWVRFLGTNGQLLVAPRKIVKRAQSPYSATHLIFQPPCSVSEALACDGADYELVEAPSVRFASIVLAEENSL